MLSKFFQILFLVTLSFSVGFSNIIAQTNSALVQNHQKDSIKQLDLIDLAGNLFKKKSKKVEREIDSTKRFQFSIFPIIGYSLQSGLVANVSGNVIFKNGKNDSTNISDIVQGISYTQNRQFEFYIQSEIWSKNTEWNFNGDFRYYIYPQETYGLGSFSKADDALLVNFSFLRLYGTIFKKVKNHLFAGMGYMLDKRWNITQEEHSFVSDYDKYGFLTTSNSSGISFNILSDSRDNPINSYKGLYASGILRFNKTFLGSDENWTSLLFDIRKYYRLGKKSNVLGIWNYYWFTLNGKVPYLDLPSTGWDANNNLGRGYIQSRFRSPNLVYLESEFRFNITRNNFLGAVIFANAQSFTEISSKKFEKIIPGFGTGLRIKFNKHTRTNLAIDYGFGLDGSGGVFVNLGEVF